MSESVIVSMKNVFAVRTLTKVHAHTMDKQILSVKVRIIHPVAMKVQQTLVQDIIAG
ncbi:unnamed protein product [Clavelina lepadiformis]|uniref:Uncharacterized protein n=1 Tax=Clavelina lepadiformis TaxID=159417 RepID=A0ABP0FCV9_CLALP